jgi:integrase
MGASKAPNTQISYAHSFKLFGEWCRTVARDSLPATAETVSLWMASMLEAGKHVATVRTRLAGVASRHVAAGYPSPVTEHVRALVTNASRLLRQPSKPKVAITADEVRAVAALSLPDRVQDIRDRAIFLLTFALGWRRSEVAGLNLSDARLELGRVTVTLGASKTDQTGKGHVAVIPAIAGRRVCPVKALAAWLDVRGKWRGPLFCRVNSSGLEIVRERISGQVICQVTKRLLSLAGVEDVGRVGGHSLRSGMITVSAENGADPIAIMQRTGHRSMATVLRYVRPAQAFRRDPLAGAL